MLPESRKDLAELGLNIRREVLGDQYVDKAMNSITDFNRPLQEILNEYCWGGCWGRDGLTRRERSMIVLGILTALGKPHEIATHTRGALNNGLTAEQIAEVFLQAAVYCGVPAAVDGFRAATPVITERNG